MTEQINKPPNAPPNNDTRPPHQRAYENLNKALANYPDGSPEHQKTLQAKEQLEKKYPELKVDSANAMTEPSMDKTVHGNTESNKDIGSKPSTQSDDGQTSTTATDDDKDDTTPINSSERADLVPASGSDPFANLRQHMRESKGNTENKNPTEPNTKNDSSPLESLRARYSQPQPDSSQDSTNKDSKDNIGT